MIYKTLKKVSEYCQILDKSKYNPSKTIYGVTFTKNDDGTFTANGTATATIDYRVVSNNAKINVVVGHKYLMRGCPAGGSKDTYDMRLPFLGFDYGNGLIAKLTDNGTDYYYIQIIVRAGIVCDNLVFKPQLFDLTEMYGAGNEPTTVEEFRTKFPNELYDYKPYCFVKSYKNCLKVSDVCQLLDKSKFPATKTMNGVTFTNNGDGTITANGTASKNIYFTILSDDLELSTHKKYLLTGCPSGGSSYTYFLYVDRDGALFDLDTGNGSIGTPTKSNAVITIFVRQGLTFNNLVFKPQLFDLTEMYGSGNEPTTVEQFRADFPNELYDYKPYSIITSYKKSLVCKTKNLFNPLGREDANPIGNWPITKYDVGNVIYRGLAYSGYYQSDESYKCDVTVSGAVITVVEKIANYGVGYIIKCNPNTVYTLSFETNFNVIVSIFLDLEGNKIGDENWSKTFTTSNNTHYLLVVLSSTTIGTYFIKNLQIELGDTATEYHPYGYL